MFKGIPAINRMTSIVIPYKTSRWQDTELRYCLRSIEKHLKGYGDIFLIGDKPDWVRGVIHIPATDDSRYEFKERSIYQKILLACNDPRVSDEFLVVDDDHFLLTDYDAATFPYYYDEWPKRRVDMYQTTISNTTCLKADMKYFNIHCPMRFHKSNYVHLMRCLDWEKKCGYLFRSLYSETMVSPSEHQSYPDLKIRLQESLSTLREMIRGRKWFSICDGARGHDMGNLLKELYPEPSKYEKVNEFYL